MNADDADKSEKSAFSAFVSVQLLKYAMFKKPSPRFSVFNKKTLEDA